MLVKVCNCPRVFKECSIETKLTQRMSTADIRCKMHNDIAKLFRRHQTRLLPLCALRDTYLLLWVYCRRTQSWARRGPSVLYGRSRTGWAPSRHISCERSCHTLQHSKHNLTTERSSFRPLHTASFRDTNLVSFSHHHDPCHVESQHCRQILCKWWQ
jgi:hypothetical protein